MTASTQRWDLWAVLTAALFAVAEAGAVYAEAGPHGFNVLRLRGGPVRGAAAQDSPRLLPFMRLALHGPSPAAQSGPSAWRTPATEFEVVEGATGALRR